MRILTVHNRYLFRGGEDESREAEDRLLRAEGHIVDEYVLDNAAIESMGRVRVGLRTIWSARAYREIRTRIRAFRPNVVNVHNFFPLISPAVHYATAAEGLPSVQTLHNYRLACLNGYFFRDGGPCERCLHAIAPWPGVAHACYRNDRLASFSTASMLVGHRLLKTWPRKVSAFLVLTEFARQKFIELGLPPQKLHLKPNFVPVTSMGAGSGGYVLYAGRLSPEKGLDVLIEAWRDGRLPPLKIIGDGPSIGMVQEAARGNPNIEVLGQQPNDRTLELMGEALALAFPSLWYEGLPRAVIEAFAKGTPVIASNLGAMRTLVAHEATGLHFEPGDSGDLRRQVTRLAADPDLRQGMRAKCRTAYLEAYTPMRNYAHLMRIYGAIGAKVEAPLPAHSVSFGR
jgi:glycosyltransferase involved in cell wall biosynthesis